MSYVPLTYVQDMEALLREPNKCYMDLDECAPGLAALDGTLDPKIKAILHDSVRTDDDPKSPRFLAECPGDGPKFLFLLGFKGVAYANMKEALPDLHKLVTKERKRQAAEVEATSEGGSSVLFDEVEPWPEPVDGAVLLDHMTSEGLLKERHRRMMLFTDRVEDAINQMLHYSPPVINPLLDKHSKT